MFYYKPTEYSPTASQRFAMGSQSINGGSSSKRSLYDDPAKGTSGDPNQSPTPQYMIRKNDSLGPASESRRFLKDSMEVDVSQHYA